MQQVLVGMQKPFYQILRFELDYPNLVDNAFKKTLKAVKEENLIKIHHLVQIEQIQSKKKHE